MEGAPPRANAAQLAQRNIKATKGRRPGGRATPLQAPNAGGFGQSQSTPTAQFGGGGGMFGGGIQAPAGGSGFNFAVAGAPAAPAFHNPFQGGPVQSGLSSNDERRDPAEERPNKRRSGGGASIGESVPLFAPIPANPFAPVQFGQSNGQQQNAGAFTFNQNTGFNATPASNPFAMKVTEPTPQQNAPTSLFGNNGQNTSGNTPFKFGQPSPQIETAASTGFTFGSSATPAKPASTSFSFGQTSGAPSTTGISFGSTPITSAPASNLFGTAQPPSTNLFGSGPQQSTPGIFANSNLNAPAVNSNSAFGSREASPAPSASTNGIFGKQEEAVKPQASNGLFGQQNLQATPSKPTNNFFGTPSQPPTSSTPFGQPKAQDTAPMNLFGSSTQAPTPSLFSEQKALPASTPFGNLNRTPSASSMFSKPAETGNTLFGGTPKMTSTSSDLFGSLNKSVGQTVTDPKPTSSPLFGNLNKPVDSTVADPKPSSSSLFANLNKPLDQAGTDPTPKSSFLFGGAGTQNQPSTVFSQPASSGGLFNGANSLVSSQRGLERTMTPPHTLNCLRQDRVVDFSQNSSTPTSQATSDSPSKPLFSFGSSQAAPAASFEPKLSSPAKTLEAPTSARDPPPSGMFPSLNKGAVAPPLGDQPTQLSKVSPQEQPTNPAIQKLKPAGPSKRRVHNGSNLSEISSARFVSAEFMAPLMPANLKGNDIKDFHAAFRVRELNRALSRYFENLSSIADPRPAFELYKSERRAILEDYNVRKAQKRPALHEPASAEAASSKRIKQGDANSTQPPTPNPRAPSPTKQQSDPPPSPHTNGNARARSPLKTATFPPPQNSSAPPASAGKRKADNDLNSENVANAEKRPLRQIKTPKAHGPAQIESSGGSNTSNIFKNLLDSPSKTPQKSPTKKTASLPSASQDVASKPNPFGGLPVPKSTTKTPAPAPSPNLFMSKTATPVESASPFTKGSETKAADFSKSTTSSSSNMFSSSTSTMFGANTSSQSSNPFAPKVVESPKPASPNPFAKVAEPPKSATPAAAPPAIKGFSMPGFSAGPVNFAAQFGQQAQKDQKDSEQKKMEKDMAEDFDSEDDDKEEWIANWKEKRRVELEKLDALTKKSTGGFSLGKQDSKKPVVAESAQPSKPLFGFSAPVPAQSNGVFSPANISRTPTPGAISSGTGSVFDAHTPGKLAPVGNNIFGHLSDSAKSDDADDESAEDSDTEADGDSENKDPNYTPQQESESGAGTPASETGAGIASAKKAAMFSFTPSKTSSVLGQSISGTTTPRGGLFDRITKDSNGNPVRVTSSEEKENTQPTPPINPFSALSKSQNAPADQTWKIDSPIKFGSATPSADASTPPVVNVTAATPTKTGSPAGIFGNLSKGPTSAPFSNLFGNLGGAKPAASPAVGFNFGGVSNTSSLFPSATTSRATSPGVTTDGDSAAEDPDAEKHEQINLTAGGPGEEDEEVVLDVRAKARQFTNKPGAESPWEMKGLGPLRILKHKDTKATRMLLRADPRGTIVLNKAILNFKYEAADKTVKVMTAGENGGGLETWLFQVKTAESATQLAEVLNANKAT